MGCKGDKQSVCQGVGDGGQEYLGGNRDHVGPGGWGWGGIFIVGKGRGHVFDILLRGKYLDCVHVSEGGGGCTFKGVARYVTQARTGPRT